MDEFLQNTQRSNFVLKKNVRGNNSLQGNEFVQKLIDTT